MARRKKNNITPIEETQSFIINNESSDYNTYEEVKEEIIVDNDSIVEELVPSTVIEETLTDNHINEDIIDNTHLNEIVSEPIAVKEEPKVIVEEKVNNEVVVNNKKPNPSYNARSVDYSMSFFAQKRNTAPKWFTDSLKFKE